MPKKMVAVPANAIITRPVPLPRPSTTPSRRDSIRPMKNVKPSNSGTAARELRFFSIAKIRPMAPTMKTIIAIAPPMDAARPVARPTQAPATVGIIDSASSA